MFPNVTDLMTYDWTHGNAVALDEELERLVESDLVRLEAELEAVGVPKRRSRSIQALAKAVHEGTLRLDGSASLDAAVAGLRSIADLSATLLHRLDLAVPSAFQGRVLWEALEETGAGQATALPDVSQVRRRTRTNEGLVESRLRALGYIE